MQILELFAGTRSIGKEFEKQGHKVISVEWNKDFENIDEQRDINTLTSEYLLKKYGYFDVIWASPDCTTYSIAAISHHRTKSEIEIVDRQGIHFNPLLPKSDYAKFCDKTNMHVVQLIKELNPKYFFIENPRGGMRKTVFMKNIPRYTITYCKYETDKPVQERRMKPTDIWTNHPNPNFLSMCHNGYPDHAISPRGSRTGTQGLKGSKERSVIPSLLCKHIVEISEN